MNMCPGGRYPPKVWFVLPGEGRHHYNQVGSGRCLVAWMVYSYSWNIGWPGAWALSLQDYSGVLHHERAKYIVYRALAGEEVLEDGNAVATR